MRLRSFSPLLRSQNTYTLNVQYKYPSTFSPKPLVSVRTNSSRGASPSPFKHLRYFRTSSALNIGHSRPISHKSHSHLPLPNKVGDNLNRPPGVRHLVAVASGKGGVGKSTVATNLSLAFNSLGLKTGLLDADIFGPSVPTMMNLTHENAQMDQEGLLLPVYNYDIACMSMGFLVPEGASLAWRGPMVIGALRQLITGVAWGELDILIVDLPPGTGDVQLSLAQQFNIDGAVVVSTPQAVALADVERAVDMFAKVKIPILGVIENMSGHQCSNCGQVDHIFGQHGARDVATRLSIPFLGDIPLLSSIREAGDSGAPIVGTDPFNPVSRKYASIAEEILSILKHRHESHLPSRIVIE